ncbi:MAG TPA: type II toxin-antitoxin system HicA family toxin [Tepidisphaeraceae bacterium]|nr:type II toxin-antitoxin system HicA family toxin [Tepidisphaeraceae bacterium]
MPSNVRFAVVKKLLERKGYILDHVTGSHHIFKKPGATNVNIPVHRNQVLYVYFKQAEKAP